MKQSKIKATKKFLKIAEELFCLILGLPLLLVESIVYVVKAKSTNKSLLTVLEGLEVLLYLPIKPIELFFDKLNRHLDKELLKEDADFKSFLRFGLHNRWVVDNKVTIVADFYGNDFNNDVIKLYRAYCKALEIVNEFNKISNEIVHGLHVLDSTIYIQSKTLYEAEHDKKSAGCFYSDSKNIYIKMTDSTIWHLVTLYHEIGHFVDLVVGFGSNNERIHTFQSDYDYELHLAFEKEVKHLRDYAKTNYREFFAVAYEHKMTNGNMRKLSNIDKIINDYLNVFSATIYFLDESNSSAC